MLDDQVGFEVRWAIAGTSIVTQVIIVVVVVVVVVVDFAVDDSNYNRDNHENYQLVARLNEGQYMAFGLSGEEDRSRLAMFL